MTNQIRNMEDRKWDGFEQMLTTPPQPGEPTIRLCDADGVNGNIFVWSDTVGRWNFTGIRLQDIPPIDSEPTVRTSITGRSFSWNQEKLRWWGE